MIEALNSRFGYGFDWIRQALFNPQDKLELLTHVLNLLWWALTQAVQKCRFWAKFQDRSVDPGIFTRSAYIYWAFYSDKAIQKMGNAARPIWTAQARACRVNERFQNFGIPKF